MAGRGRDPGPDRVALRNTTGESRLYPITAARKAREDENLERRYLHGHYGGVPELTTGDVARQIARVEEKWRAEH